MCFCVVTFELCNFTNMNKLQKEHFTLYFMASLGQSGNDFRPTLMTYKTGATIVIRKLKGLDLALHLLLLLHQSIMVQCVIYH